MSKASTNLVSSSHWQWFHDQIFDTSTAQWTKTGLLEASLFLLSWKVCHPQTNTCYNPPIYQIWSL